MLAMVIQVFEKAAWLIGGQSGMVSQSAGCGGRLRYSAP